MALRATPLELAPDDEDDEVIVSRRKLDQLLKEKERKVAQKDAEITRLKEDIRRLRKESEAQAITLTELERKVAVHENPNVPPSVKNQAPGHTRSHPLTPPEKRKKPGQKPGHEGVTREPVTPDKKVTYTAPRCGKCQSPRLKLVGQETTDEVELPPPPKPTVTRHTQNVYACEDCGAETRATMPDGREPSGWGPRLRAEVVLGKFLDRLPYRKLRARLVRQGGELLWMSTATLQGIVWKASDHLAGEEAAIRERLRASPHIHIDESIFRVDGHREWLWVFVTAEDVFLVIDPRRNRDVVTEILGEDYAGKIHCDGWKAYIGWVLQRCWSHLLRYGKEGAEKSPLGAKLYAELCALYEKLTRGLETASLRARVRRLNQGNRALRSLLKRYGESGDAAVEKVVTYLGNGMPWWLTFLGTPGMEATNNRGERGLREAIVIRKIIGTLRNKEGATAFTRLLSVLGTWSLRGEDLPSKLQGVLSRPG